MNRRSLRVLAVAALSNSSVAMAPGLIIILAVQIRAEIGVTPFQFGLGLAGYSLAIVFLSVRLGRFADRVGWARAVLLAMAISIALLLAIALSLQSLLTLLIFFFLTGIVIGLGIPATGLALAREVPADKQGLTFGVKEAAVPFTFLLGGLAIPAVALTIGWRWAFVIGVALPLLTSALILIEPRDLKRPEKKASEAANAGAQPEAPPLPREFRILQIGAGLAIASLAGISFSALSVVDAGISEASAGLLIAVASAFGIVSRIAIGMIADRRHSGGFPESAFMLFVGAIGYAILVVHTPTAAVVGIILMYAFGWGFIGVFWEGAAAAHPQAPASATAFLLVGFGAGVAIGPTLFGALVDLSGYPLAWATMSVLGVVAAATVYGGFRRLSARAQPG